MQPAELINELKKIFSVSKAQQVIPALRRDALLWNALMEESFFKKVAAYSGDNWRKWSPAYLALLALNQKITPNAEMIDLMLPAQGSPEAIQRFFEETRQVIRPPKTLVEAGKLSLAILARLRAKDTQKPLLQELLPAGGEAERQALLTWQTPLTCLVGMVDDPLEVLRALLPKRTSHLVMYWVCQAVFTNPFDFAAQADIFSALLASMPPAQQLSWLRYLNLTQSARLASEVAQRLLTKSLTANTQLYAKTNPDLLDIETAIVRSLELQRMAGLYRFANQPANARIMLDKAKMIVQHWLAGLSIQDADLMSLENQEQAVFTALSNSLNLGGSSNSLQSEILFSAQENSLAEGLVERLSEQSSNPISQIFLAGRIAATGEIDFAKEMAARAVEIWLQQVDHSPLPFTPQFAFEWHPELLLETLVNLQLVSQAAVVAEKLLEMRVNDPQLQYLVSKIYDRAGETRQALLHAQLAATLIPEKAEYHAVVGNLWGKLGNWLGAYLEQQQAIFLNPVPDAQNWATLAHYSVNLKDWMKVIDACDQALTIEPDLGTALAMKGQALAETGKTDEASRILGRATLLAPEEPIAWLQLARLYERQNNSQRSLETLRAAVLAVPNSSEVNFALARACLNQGLVSDALPCLRKAGQLDPESVEIAIDLGQTLTQLGHLEDALQMIAQARQRWPQHPRLAFIHARAELASGNRDTALKGLETALEDNAPDYSWYLLFAQVVLGKDPGFTGLYRAEPAWIVKAQKAMEKALLLQPDHYEAQLLLAEIVEQKGDDELAFQLFRNLMDFPEFQAEEYRWRVQAGLGQVSLKLKQYENALALLQEALQDQPENLKLQHLLAEAYLESELFNQAAATARYALKIRPEQLENLAWYADIMARLGETAEAIQALETATQLSPASPENWLKLADLHFAQKNFKAVSKVLATFEALPVSNLEHVYRYARIQLALDDTASAVAGLRKIKNPDSSICLAIAGLSLKSGQFEIGYQAAQNATLQSPDDALIYVVQADLLDGLTRYEAALACLQHALRLAEETPSSKEPQNHIWNRLAELHLVDEKWLAEVQAVEGVHDRLARLYRQMGDLSSALYHAGLAFELNPLRNQLRLQEVELSEALLLSDRVERLVRDLDGTRPDGSGSGDATEMAALAQLLAIRAELAYTAGRAQEAKSLVEHGLQISLQPRLFAIQARLCAWEGDWPMARATLEKTGTNQAVWNGKAALDLYQWDQGLRILEGLSGRFPAHVQAQYWFARGLATAALTRKTGLLLGLEERLPGEHVLSEKAQSQFEQACTLAMKSSSREPARWQTIGKAIFLANPQTVRDLAALLPGETEAAALVACLRETNNLAGAVQVAEQYQDTPEVLLQLALAYLAAEPRRALDVARKAAVLRPHSPLYQVLVSQAASQAGDITAAFDSMADALDMWPDEPKWHIIAADYGDQLGLDAPVIAHWEAALAVLRDRQPHILKASRAFLAHQQGQKAIQLLEDTAAQQPANAEIWNMLGSAYLQGNRLNAALTAADKAYQAAPDALENALLLGSIHQKIGHLDEALEWSLRAINLDSQDPKAVLLLSKVYAQRKNFKDALNVLENAVSRQIVNLDILIERAGLVRQLNGSALALPLLQEIDADFPNEACVLRLMAKVQMDLGNAASAEKYASQVLSQEPDQPEMNLLLGKLLRQSGQLDHAVACLSKTIRQQPNHSEAYLELAQAYQDRRETMEALQVYQKAMKLIPQDHHAFYQAGLILRENKDYRGAEVMLRRAAELAPDDVNIRRQLGAVMTLNLIHSSQEASSSHEPQYAARL